MDSPHALPPQLTEALARGWTVLTANQRAARTLRRAYDRRQQALGLATWHPPTILAWDTWLATLWRHLLLEGHANALLLNPTQEHTLWRAVIEADQQADRTSTAPTLRPTDSLAELAASAWLLLHAYRARRRLSTAADTTDTRAFTRWAAEFDRRATRANYLTHAQLPETLRTAISANHLKPPLPGLLLIGFDTKTPAQSALLEALQDTGVPLEELHPALRVPHDHRALSEVKGKVIVGTLTPNPLPENPDTPSLTPLKLGSKPSEQTPHPISVISTTNPHDELSTCAHWLRTHLTTNPRSRLAVIVPNLEATRAQIDHAFLPILAPELEDIAAPANSGPYEFSLGIPLAHTPLVATALDILRWAAAPLPLDRVSALLLSPHFAPTPNQTTPEHLARAEFDAFTLRRQTILQPETSIDDLYTLVSHPKSAPSLPILLDHLRTLRRYVRATDLTADRPHAEWATTIHDILAAAGWSAPHRDTSVDFQTRRRWEHTLDESATLDFDATRVPFTVALAALQRIAAQTLFAPESRHAPIQIMGPLEAAGSTFDAIWFLHAGDLTWPAKAAPNPLLPWRLQRDLAMPGTDPAVDSALALRITERIALSAPTVLFSYARETPDGHQRPSALLTQPTFAGVPIDLRTAAQIAPPEPIPIEAVTLEAVPETPIPPPPDRVLEGGAAILQSQAACAFRAFAEKRLNASAPDTRTLGLDPAERGTLVHKVLERFWAEVETHAALQLMTILERDALLAGAIDETLHRLTSHSTPGWSRAYLDTERQRLLQLLRPWLDYELTRAPFTVKSREETLHDVQIGPLRLDIRVDRIDRIDIDRIDLAQDEANPSEPSPEIILDYKTGFARPSGWLGDRPDAPQLPLYAAVSQSPNLAAVAFANVRPGKDMGINGFEARPGILPKSTRLKTPSLEAQVEDWRAVLTVLAEAFHAGDTRVLPKQYPATCRFCQQRLLCRLDPASLDADALEDLSPFPDADSDSPEDFPEADRG